MAALESVEEALHAAGSSQRYGGNWTCPAHIDDKPSLSVTSSGYGVGLYCHAGCTTDAILGVLGLTIRNLFEESGPADPVDRYFYRDRQGNTLYAKFRYQPKGFSLAHPAEHGWVKGIGDSPRVLYRLPELMSAIAAGKTVYVVEGEKDCDRLALSDEAATTNFDGAGGKWRPEYTEVLHGARVVIIADRDDPGVEHARKIAAELKGHAASVKIVQSVTEGKGHDVSDHLDNGFGLAELVPLDEAGFVHLYKRLDWHLAFKAEQEEVSWLKEDFLEAGTLNCLFSKPGVGKSLLSLEIAVEIVRAGKTVMYLDDENRSADIVDRLRSLRCEPGELDGLVMYNFQNLPPLDTDIGGLHLDALAEANEPDLVIIDTVSRMIKGGENEADTFIQLYRCSLTRLKKRGVAILRLDHSGKDSTRGQRGSSAKESDADVLWYLSRDGESAFSLECQKSRSGHVPFGTIINLTREYEPLRHIWNVRIDMPYDRFAGVLRQMDGLGVSTSLGRPAVRKILKDNGISAGNDMLHAAIIERRNRERRRPVRLSVPPADSYGQSDSEEYPWLNPL